MQFERRLRLGIADGSITMTFRRWARPQVVAGHRYRTGDGIIEMDAVDVIDARRITEDEARRAGYDSAAELLGDLRGPAHHRLYRLRFHRIDSPDPRALLADDLKGLLEALDRGLATPEHAAFVARLAQARQTP